MNVDDGSQDLDGFIECDEMNPVDTRNTKYKAKVNHTLTATSNKSFNYK